MIRIKRVYEPAASGDGKRFLVERLWPRGMKKEALAMDRWFKDAAPSTELRRWFGHDPGKWTEFQRRYRAELKAAPQNWSPLVDAARAGGVTLLFSSHDLQHNNAVVLKAFLDEQLKSKTKARKGPGRQGGGPDS